MTVANLDERQYNYIQRSLHRPPYSYGHTTLTIDDALYCLPVLSCSQTKNNPPPYIPTTCKDRTEAEAPLSPDRQICSAFLSVVDVYHSSSDDMDPAESTKDAHNGSAPQKRQDSIDEYNVFDDAKTYYTESRHQANRATARTRTFSQVRKVDPSKKKRKCP